MSQTTEKLFEAKLAEALSSDPDISREEVAKLAFQWGYGHRGDQVQKKLTLADAGCNSIEQMEALLEVNDVDKNDVAFVMVNHGSGFVTLIGRALPFATEAEVAGIKKAFPDYWIRFAKLYLERYHVEEDAA